MTLTFPPLGRTGAAMLCLAITHPLGAQISRHPTGVNVNATAATTVFITFGNLNGRVPVEALWCGEIVSAAPHIGQRCDPNTIFGRLPLRYDRSRASGANGYTDVMTIPPSVARRAYQAAASGVDSRFYYVRRFVDPRGGPDEFVSVTCRMTDGGARTPFALLDVTLAFATGEPALSLGAADEFPEIQARIHYNGTGRMRGRWEIVRPGEVLPDEHDLLTEATLPQEQRGTQRRYTELARFDVLLAPGGPYELPGPAPARLPKDAEGMYLVLLRIEATDDKEGDSDLASARAGNGITHAAGVAGFPMPVLRYVVGAAIPIGTPSSTFRQLAPNENASLAHGPPITFVWTAHAHALYTRLEIERLDTGTRVLEVVLPRGTDHYRAPPWLVERVGAALRWRVLALRAGGRVLQSTPWRAAALPNQLP
ncbi:MAG: hypothetical protein AB1762_17340 [Gemmatimonadota bacterium]